MKKILIVALLLISVSTFAEAPKRRFELWSGSAMIRANENETVADAFKKLSEALPRKWFWFDRYVEKNGVIYYRSFLSRKIHVIQYS